MIGKKAMTQTERTRRYRKNRPQKANEVLALQKEIRHKTKVEVQTHYGNGKLACVVCGEDRPDCLSIDHIEGGGNRQRTELKLRTTHSFYRWLQKNGYPEGYQTLCMNCQFIKRFANGEHSNHLDKWKGAE